MEPKFLQAIDFSKVSTFGTIVESTFAKEPRGQCGPSAGNVVDQANRKMQRLEGERNMNISKHWIQKRLAAAFAVAGLFAMSALASTAQAVVFDFAAIGAIAGQEQGNPGEMDGVPIGLRFVEGDTSVHLDTFDGLETGLQVIATGGYVVAGDGPFAYLDGISGGLPAGLGVCQVLSGTQCDPSDDDNVTGSGPTEILTLRFSDAVAFNPVAGVAFRGELHSIVDAGEIDGDVDTLVINGIGTTFDNALATLVGLGFSDTFTFAFGGDHPEQFYLSVVDVRRRPPSVPEPSALGILGFGIVLLAIAGRLRRVL